MKYLPALIILLSLISCEELTETNLSKQRVEVLAPVDGAVVREGIVLFSWKELGGARQYRLRLLELRDGLPVNTVADTLMINDTISVKTKFRVALQEGEYKWSVRAGNGSFESMEEHYNLTVEAEETGTE